MNRHSYHLPPFTKMAAILGAFGLIVVSYFYANQYYFEKAVIEAGQRTAFHQIRLGESLGRYQHLPFILSQDPLVIAAIADEDRSELNLRFEDFAEESQVDAIYLMDTEGKTIASSNWRNSNSFLGHNYGFRPYFKDAIVGKPGEFFAIGATTRQPGYFIARRVLDGNKAVAGVLAVKVDLRPLEKSWRDGGENLIAVNSDGVVTLSSNDEWRYRSLAPLSKATLQKLQERRQFADEALSPLPIETRAENEIEIAGQHYVETSTALGYLDWRLYYLADRSSIKNSTNLVVIGVIGLELSLLLIFVLLRSQRIRAALLTSQQDSLELRQLNEALRRQMDERERAEAALQHTEKELQQANKLAVLGQLSASVSHELSQPLAAMKTYLASARYPDDNPADTYSLLDKLVERMDRITRQLKFFARKSDEIFGDVAIDEVVENAILMLNSRIEESGIDLHLECLVKPLMVRGDSIRLEQVVINLINNAIDAMQEATPKRLVIKLTKQDSHAMIEFSDSGSGFDEADLAHLFEPFYTTKPSGQGTGLGLSISSTILREHSGSLEADNAQHGGAVMTVKLPLLDANDHGD
ncbi:MAG: ATP-binding protein [Pseudomonadota bacterium]